MACRPACLGHSLLALIVVSLGGCTGDPFADLPGPRQLAAVAPAAGPAEAGMAPLGPAAAATERPPEDWQAFDDCQLLLRHVRTLVESDRLRRDDPPPLVVTTRVDPDDWGWLEDETAWLEQDLPLQVVGGSWPADPAVRCRIEVGPAADLVAEQREIGVESVASLYHSHSRSTANPQYEAAKNRVKEAERSLKDGGADVIEVGDPMLDLVGLVLGGVLSGLQARGGQANLNQAMQELTRTPRTLNQPVFRPYAFERTLIRGRKSAVIPVALVDARSGRRWQTRLHQREARAFEILDGLDPRDRDYASYRERSTSRLELERWHDRPPVTSLSSIVAALVRPGLRAETESGPVPIH